jgi:DNA invertase Pin-like site-specific DNA recombinase
MSMENSKSKPNIRVIPAKPRQTVNDDRPAGIIYKERVCAYARVSTDSEEQESSYENQVRHFTEYINRREDWEYAGIYADEGLSGKNLKRPQFVKMIKDCESGKVDRIITKSVSRFARNTLDCIQTVRKLKEKGIGVYFEKENLDTMKETSEFVLTLMASLAEEESRSISNNIRWSVKKRFEQGKVIMSTARFLGYTKDEYGNLRIVPEEAMIIKKIYQEFLDGYSLNNIKISLEEDKIKTPSGGDLWHVSTIKSILQNEKYKGDSLLQKTYLADFLSPRRVKNEGQAQMYYVEDSHPAIIPKDIFDCVQREFERRNELRSSGDTGKGKYSGKYVFSGMIICGCCGESYRRHQQYNKYKKYYTWVCKQHENEGKSKCKAKPIQEEALKKAFVTSLNNLIGNKEALLEKLKNAISDTLKENADGRLAQLDRKIKAEQEAIVDSLRDRQMGKITEEEYIKISRQGMYNVDNLNMERLAITAELGKMQLADYRKEEIIKLLNTSDKLSTFDKTIFKSLVREIKVTAPKEIEISYNCGLTVKEQIK